VNADGEVFQRAIGHDRWDEVGGSLTHVSIAADGSVWGANAQDEIYVRTGTRWQRVPGALKQVSVGAADLVWGVNRHDRIFRRT
jgi:hypothetical protein